MQLNKGEQLHNLRAYLWFFGGYGAIKKKQEHQQQITTQALNVLSNFVMVWNTVYIQEILNQLKSEGYWENEDDFVHYYLHPFSTSTDSVNMYSAKKSNWKKRV